MTRTIQLVSNGPWLRGITLQIAEERPTDEHALFLDGNEGVFSEL